MISDVAALIDAGFRVIPTERESKKPAVSGWAEPDFKGLSKDDLPKFYGATAEASAYGVGILTGKTSTGRSIFVVDVDDLDVWASFRSDSEATGETGAFAAVTTPRGGFHLYYRVPDGVTVTNANTFPKGIDVRGEGGFVVAPPTPGYRWVEEEEKEQWPGNVRAANE